MIYSVKAFNDYLFNKGIENPVYITPDGKVSDLNMLLSTLELAVKASKSYQGKDPLYIYLFLEWQPDEWHIRWKFTKNYPENCEPLPNTNIFIVNYLEGILNTNNPDDLQSFYIGSLNYLLLNLPDIPEGVKVIAKSRYWVLLHDPERKLSHYLDILAKKGLLPFSQYNQNVYQTLKTL